MTGKLQVKFRALNYRQGATIKHPCLLVRRKGAQKSMSEKETLRSRLRQHSLCNESDAITHLLERARLSQTDRSRITDIARSLISKIRSDSSLQLTESFLAQYELSTDEGIALMCLAEALLRVPDSETVDALIHDKIVPADWGKHLGQSSSSLVNASTWALLLTGKVIAEDDASPGVVASLRGAIKRLGEPVIRTAVNQAIRELGNQFVLGETIEQATVNAAKSPGYTFSYDMLGEAARTEADAKRYHLAYSRAISTLGNSSNFETVAENPGISVKLSALHPRYEFAQREHVMVELVARTRSLAMLAQSANMGFNIDAEEADRLDLSLDVIETVLSEGSLKDWQGFGVVVQAYSKRAPYLLDCLYDMAKRLDRKIMVRLVKGAYWDYEIKQSQIEGLHDFPVFTKKCNTDVSYIVCAKQLFSMQDRIYPQFATHNAHTVAAILQLAGAEASDSDHHHFEFQRLHGMGEALHEQVMKQYNTRCRIYAPVGAHEDLLAYLVRRLLENGANSSFVNQIVDDSISVDEVASDPFTQVENSDHHSHPVIEFADKIYSPKRPNSKGYWLSDPLQFGALNTSRESFASHLWQAGSDNGTKREIRNPANTSEIVGYCHDANSQQAADAIAHANASFESWNATSFEHRAQLLNKCADALEHNTAELCAVLAREAGKTLPDCIAEIREAVDFLRYYAVRATELVNRHNAHGCGVFVCISPWNFPLAIFTGQIAAALACGNTVVAKPAEQTPLVAELTVKLFHQSGVPHKVLQLLVGDGAIVGNALVSDPSIAGVCFTGSTQTAQIIHSAIANQGNPGAVLIAETGGLNAMVIDSTALPEQAVASVIESSFQSAGQRCSALRVLYVQEDIYDKFLIMLKGAMDLLKIGTPWQLSTDVGPLIDAQALKSITAYIELNKDRILHTTTQASSRLAEPAHFIPPTLISVNGIGDMDQEIFGPVLHLAKYSAGDFFKVIDDINASGYGLTFGLHTRVDERVQDAVNAIEAGNIYINRNQIGAIVESQPFGGKKLSGTGPKAGGPHYLLRFLKLDNEESDAVNQTAMPDTESIQANDSPALRPFVTGTPLVGHTTDLIKNLPDAFNFCQREISTAIELANTHFHPTKDLPGPTGESNRLSMEPAGTILSLSADNDAQWIAQTVQSIWLGNATIMAGPGATVHATQLSEWLSPYATGSLQACDISIQDALELIKDVDIDAVAIAPTARTLQSLRSALASRTGPIVSVATTLFDISPLVSEKSLCIDTTAAGGNASLLAAAG